MAVRDKPSEYGGRVQRNGIQPPVTPKGAPGHEPTASEKLRLIYQTGQDEDSTRNPDSERESFNGLLPPKEAIEVAKREKTQENVHGDPLPPVLRRD